jgi:hypothetical protein
MNHRAVHRCGSWPTSASSLQLAREWKMRVIAKAYGDEPLDRTTSGEGAGVVFLVNPDMNRSDSYSESGVGFPRSCVYQFDSALLESLRRAWADEDHTELGRLWNKATPLGSDAKAAA